MGERYVFIRKDQFPREVAVPQRYLVHSWDKFKEFVQNNVHKTDIYTTVYSYDDIQVFSYKKYNIDTATTIVDKVFLDLDPEGKGQECWENVQKLHRGLKEENLRHNILFSGGGFHIYVYAEYTALQNERKAVRNAAYSLVEKYGVDEEFVDTSVIGDFSRITRVPNSFNHKKNRKRYCIPLNDSHFNLTYDEICKEADEPNFDYDTWGTEKLNLVDFDRDMKFDLELNTKTTNRFDIEAGELAGKSISDVDLPRCLERLLQAGKEGEHISHDERFVLIKWMSDMMIDIEDANKILREHLLGTKSGDRRKVQPSNQLHKEMDKSRPETDYEHMINDTSDRYGQLSYIYDKDNNRFWSHRKLVRNGVCEEHWGECQRVYPTRTTMKNRDPYDIHEELEN